MKSLKNVLAAVAFVFAFGAATISNAALVGVSGTFINPSTGVCTPGTTDQDKCDIQVTPIRCTIQGNLAFQDSPPAPTQCSVALYRQP